MSSTTRSKVTIYYVPADCGSVIPGKSKAPAAFRTFNLADRLRSKRLAVTEIDDVLQEPATYAISTLTPGRVRNESLNLSVCKAVHSSLLKHQSKDGKEFQLIIGGECCMSPAIMSATWHARAPLRVGLLYIDGDLDLASPTDPDSTGFFASTNMVHLLGRPGALKEMQEQLCRPDGRPVCDASNTVFFGANASLASNKPEHWAYLAKEGYKVVTSTQVAADPEKEAREAVKWLEERVDVIMVHFDVDSIDPSEFPLANVPNFTGVSHEKMLRALGAIMVSEKVEGLTVAEVNPDHDPSLGMTGVIVDGIAEWLAPA